jgi:hypothetical protein
VLKIYLSVHSEVLSNALKAERTVGSRNSNAFRLL